MPDSFLLGSLNKEQLMRLIRQTKAHAAELLRQGHEEMERAQRMARLMGIDMEEASEQEELTSKQRQDL